MIYMVVGARPNFMKMAPVILEAKRRQRSQCVIHTGQHYDAAMSEVFFDQLGMPKPDVDLGVGSGSHAEQTARVMTAFEPLCRDRRPALVVVSGDVNSTLACALVAAKLQVPVAHLEAGLRSFDRSMPEEINRVLTDHLSALLLVSESTGLENLKREGIQNVHWVGNCMIDSLRRHLPVALAREPWRAFGLQPGAYALLTLHRPAAVDDPARLGELRDTLCEIARELPLVFPVHPRTRQRIATSEWNPIQLVDPLSYLDFIGLMAKARLVFTDSGGIQEETTALGVPCVTLRENTERPITVTEGTNRLAGLARDQILRVTHQQLSNPPVGRIPQFWDGKAAERVLDVIDGWLSTRPTPRA